MAVRFQTDPLSGSRAVRMATGLGAARRANELADQAELTTAALEGGAIADMRADQATRESVQTYAGGRPPATQEVDIRPEGRTIAVNNPVPPPAPPPPPAPMAPAAGAPAAPAAPAPTAQPTTSALRAPAPQQAPAQTAPQQSSPAAAAPPPQGSAPVASSPAPASPGAGGPPPAPGVVAGGGNPLAAGRSRLMQDLYTRFAAIPGGGSAALRLATQEANRQLAVLGSVLQMAQTNPQGALMLMREHGIEVTPETQAMLTNGAIRQRALQALTEANRLHGTGPGTAGRRAAYLEGRLGARNGRGPATTPDAPMSPGMSAAATAPTGYAQQVQQQIQPQPFQPLGSNRIIQNPMAGGQEEGNDYYPESVPSGPPSIGGPSLLEGTGIPLLLPPPGADPSQPGAPPMFQDYQPQEPYPAAGPAGRPAAAPRVTGGNTTSALRSEASGNAAAIRFAQSVRVQIPGGDPNGSRLTNPGAQQEAMEAFLAGQAGDRAEYVRRMRRAAQIQAGQNPDQQPEDNSGMPLAPTESGGGISGMWQGFLDADQGVGMSVEPLIQGAQDAFSALRRGIQFGGTQEQPFYEPGTEAPRMPDRSGIMGRMPAPAAPYSAPDTPSAWPSVSQGTPSLPMPAPNPDGPAMPQFRGPLPPTGYAPPRAAPPVAQGAPSMGYDAIPPYLYDNGQFYTFSGQFTSQGRPVYSDPSRMGPDGRPMMLVPE